MQQRFELAVNYKDGPPAPRWMRCGILQKYLGDYTAAHQQVRRAISFSAEEDMLLLMMLSKLINARLLVRYSRGHYPLKISLLYISSPSKSTAPLQPTSIKKIMVC